ASGSLFVLVTDAAGSPIAGAVVSTTPATQSLTTDNLGTAFFSTVAADGYAVTAVHPTAGSGRSAGEVKANDVARVTITLIPGVTLPTTGQAGAGGRGGVGGAAPGGSGGTGGAASGGAIGTGGIAGSAGVAGSAGTGGNSAVLMLAPPTKDQGGVTLSWTVTPG